VTEWTKCQYNTQDPKRRAFKVPKEYHDVELLKKYKYKKRARVFPAEAACGKVEAVSSSSQAKPLAGMKFVIGKTEKGKEMLTGNIVAMGGKVVNRVDSRTMAVISSKSKHVFANESITIFFLSFPEEASSKSSKLMKEAQTADIHVVSEDFLTAAEKGGAVLLVQTHSLCSWGSDVSFVSSIACSALLWFYVIILQPVGRVEDLVDGPSKSASKSMMKSLKDGKLVKCLNYYF
jgi:poly [ADP-ribose] polymerase